MARNEANRVALEVVQKFVDSGQEIDIGEVKLALRAALEPFHTEMFGAFVDQKFKMADDRLRHKEDRQLRLFDVGGWYVLSESRRIGKRHARLRHMQEHLAFVDMNYEAVRAARDREHREFALLQPYLETGMTKLQAVEAYRAEHPDEEDLAA